MQVWNSATGKRLALCSPGHDGPVKWVSAARTLGTALVSIGGSTLKVWDASRWMCVRTVDISAQPDDVPPRGLPPGMTVPATPHVPPVSTLSRATLMAASMQAIPSSMYGDSKHDPRVLAGSGKDLIQQDSLAELPSSVMDDLAMPSLSFSASKSLIDKDMDTRVLPEGVHDTHDASGAARVRGIPPHFPRRAGTHADPMSALKTITAHDSAHGDGTTGVLAFEGIATVQPRPTIVPITDNAFRVALVIEVRGEHQLEGHHIVCGYGDGSLQVFSVFDWTFQYRIPNAHHAAVTALLQFPDGTLVSAACDGVFKVRAVCDHCGCQQ